MWVPPLASGNFSPAALISSCTTPFRAGGGHLRSHALMCLYAALSELASVCSKTPTHGTPFPCPLTTPRHLPDEPPSVRPSVRCATHHTPQGPLAAPQSGSQGNTPLHWAVDTNQTNEPQLDTAPTDVLYSARIRREGMGLADTSARVGIPGGATLLRSLSQRDIVQHALRAVLTRRAPTACCFTPQQSGAQKHPAALGGMCRWCNRRGETARTPRRRHPHDDQGAPAPHG